MRFLVLFLISGVALKPGAATSANESWIELKAKREKLSSYHQELEVARTIKTAYGSRSSTWKIALDVSKGQWRETSLAGSGNKIKIFDGKDLFSMEQGADEYVRTKRQSAEEDALPAPYEVSHLTGRKHGRWLKGLAEFLASTTNVFF